MFEVGKEKKPFLVLIAQLIRRGVEDLIGAFCELLYPWRGYSNGTIVDDYGTEWLVQLTNGREIPVYKDEVFII